MVRRCFRWNTAHIKAPSSIEATNQDSINVVAIQGGALRFVVWNFSGASDLKLPGRVISPKTARTPFVPLGLVVLTYLDRNLLSRQGFNLRIFYPNETSLYQYKPLHQVWILPGSLVFLIVTRLSLRRPDLAYKGEPRRGAH